MDSTNRSTPQLVAASNTTINHQTKEDPAGEHAEQIRNENGTIWHLYKFCGVVIKGGGINRFKKHLEGERGQVASCKKLTHDIRERFKGLLALSAKPKTAARNLNANSVEQDTSGGVGGTNETKSILKMVNLYTFRSYGGRNKKGSNLGVFGGKKRRKQ